MWRNEIIDWLESPRLEGHGDEEGKGSVQARGGAVLCRAPGVGLLVRYDFSTDESTEMFILKSNGAEYVAQLFGEDSGLHTFFQRYVGNVKRISDSVDRDHGTSAYYVFLPAMAVLQHFLNYAAHIGWQCYTFMLFRLGVVALYGIARELFHGSRWLSCTAALLLYLTPRMFAEGHYN